MRFNVHASRRARWGPIAVLLAAVCVFGTAATRSAAHSIIPTLKGVFPVSGGYVWLYRLDLNLNVNTGLPASQVQNGDYFEQADLDNALSHINRPNLGFDLTTTPSSDWGVGTDMPAGWSASWLPIAQPIPNPGSISNPTITPGLNPNTWAALVQWGGSGNAPSAVNGIQGYLGDYAFLSASDYTRRKDGGYGAQDHSISGSQQANSGTVDVPGPVPVSGAHTAVIGLFGSTLFLLRMRKRA